MKNRVIVLLSSVVILTACMVRSTPRGGLEIIPILPTVVEIDDDSYYEHNGYHYFYTNERWYYSNSRNGRRSELPRDHWPRETRHRGRDHRGEDRH